MQTKIRIKQIKPTGKLSTNLEVRGGRLVLRKTGREPFIDVPDGTAVNLFPRESAQILCWQAAAYCKSPG